MPIPWNKDNCAYTIQKKIAAFFEENIDVYFGGDVKAAKEEHDRWSNSVKERKRDAKEKLKERTATMDKKQKDQFKASLLQDLKERYVSTL